LYFDVADLQIDSDQFFPNLSSVAENTLAIGMSRWESAREGGVILFHYSLVVRVGNFHFIIRGLFHRPDRNW
jgi:hypothetical protein